MLDKLGGAFVSISHALQFFLFIFGFWIPCCLSLDGDLSPLLAIFALHIVLIGSSMILCTQAPKPSSGPHKSRECLPLILILRNRLKYALTYREVIAILMQRHIQVDGKVRTDKTYPAGFMGMHLLLIYFLL